MKSILVGTAAALLTFSAYATEPDLKMLERSKFENCGEMGKRDGMCSEQRGDFGSGWYRTIEGEIDEEAERKQRAFQEFVKKRTAEISGTLPELFRKNAQAEGTITVTPEFIRVMVGLESKSLSPTRCKYEKNDDEEFIFCEVHEGDIDKVRTTWLYDKDANGVLDDAYVGNGQHMGEEFAAVEENVKNGVSERTFTTTSLYKTMLQEVAELEQQRMMYELELRQRFNEVRKELYDVSVFLEKYAQRLAPAASAVPPVRLLHSALEQLVQDTRTAVSYDDEMLKDVLSYRTGRNLWAKLIEAVEEEREITALAAQYAAEAKDEKPQ